METVTPIVTVLELEPRSHDLHTPLKRGGNHLLDRLAGSQKEVFHTHVCTQCLGLSLLIPHLPALL